MTPTLWTTVSDQYKTIRALKDDVEDGMWDEVKEAWDLYMEICNEVKAEHPDFEDRSAVLNTPDGPRDEFLEVFNDILADYGYPVITEPITEAT